MNILQECQQAKTIGISGHIRPDGDCIGSALALYLYLTKNLPEAEVHVYLENPPEIFAELAGFDKIEEAGESPVPMDVFFALDSVPERMGNASLFYEAAAKKINIDHHTSNTGAGPLTVVESSVGSCAEVLYDLLEHDKIDGEIALCIYVGMIHDTGIFQYSNTSPATMRKAADLMEYGFEFPRIIEETFYQKSYVQAQIMGRALMESVRFMDGRCIVGCVDRKTMEFYNVTSKDFDGIVNQLRNIKGIDCAIFMYETGTLEYKVSLRTTPRVDASKIVAHFGGGGHPRAAGCNMRGTFHDCVNNLSYFIEAELRENT